MNSVFKVVKSCVSRTYTLGWTTALRLAPAVVNKVDNRDFSRKSTHPPSRPPTAFILFYKEIFPRLWSTNTTRRVKDVARQVGEIWKSQSASEKRPFEDRSNEMMHEYKDAMNRFRAKATDEDLELFKATRAMKKKRKLMANVRRDRRRHVPPRPSPFGLFVQEQSQMISQPLKGRILFKHLAEDWRDMSEEEKNRYKEESEKKMKYYQEKLGIWKARSDQND